MLYIVATPIGNLEDITLRALRILKEVDLIAAEDTRHSKILLDKYEIQKPLLSYHSYSGETKLDKIISMLLEGKNIALISDAGTPGISDPAYNLIKTALENGIKVSPIPGPSSLLAALTMSGLRMNQFLYLGFLPLKKGRQTLLKSLRDEERTIVIFESPHRILKTLDNLKEYLGDREIAVCREIT
ncbi:16S rRNA (cytidine(1402)-2'-O)-methyltransferase, partial [Candidatus Peregrinibacteria bacterium]|nr:16S rRNA (cytidine(1402)-2'-O)-methyltransferase [Candidatus Peregrinibacteria bacterium]